jgi:FMN phosphatase YigB (HAD superfamily)
MVVPARAASYRHRPMAAPRDNEFYYDCDDTLLDNDRIHDDLDAAFESVIGRDNCARYWAHYQALREELGYADYLGAVQRLRCEAETDMRILGLSSLLLDFPFASRLYAGALEAIAHCRAQGLTVILSDGDAVLQPRKLQRAGLWDCVEGRVLVYVHKDRMLVAVQQRYPAAHYVMVDDKPQLLARMKQHMGNRLTTVFVRQGHYAEDAAAENVDPAPDIAIACIGDLRGRKLEDFLPTAAVINLPSHGLPSG